MADPVDDEVQEAGGFTSTKGIANALSVAINQVNEVLVGQVLSERTFHDIKMYLACHYTELTQSPSGSIIQSKIGEAREDYANVFKAGLFSTKWGQMVCMLDSTGKFSALAAQAEKPQKKAQFTNVEAVNSPEDPSFQ